MKIQPWLVGIGVWALLGCAPLAAQRFLLTGTVVDGATNQPIPGAVVILQTLEWDAMGDPATTDAQGRFAFGGLAAGSYNLSAEGSGFGTVRYGEGFGALRVGGAQKDKSVVFKIAPRASIDGVVRDEFGDPMMGAAISLVRSVWRDGRTTSAVLALKNTDDRGRYRFGNLPPAAYSLCATGNQNSTAPLPGPVDFVTRVTNRAYIRTCTRTFQLAPGQHTQVDLSPQVGSTATVSGQVRNLPPRTGIGVYLAPEDGGQTIGAATDGTGAFAIRNVPPGRYRLRATGGSTQGVLTADLPLDVASDLSGVDLPLEAGGTVEVAFHGEAENRLERTTVTAMLRSADSATNSRGASRDKDGGMKFEGLPAGRYRLTVSTPRDACVASVKLGDREVRGTVFDLPPGAALRLDVAVTRTCGTVALRAVRDGEAAPGARVVLLMSGTPQDPGELKEDFADDEGGYSFSSLPPGRYLLWAWVLEGSGAIANPASLAAVEGQATAVEVKAGEIAQIDVPLLTSEGKGQ